MALTYDEIDAHVRKKFIPTLVDQFYFSFPMFVRLASKSNIQFNSGKNIAIPLLYGDLPGGSYSGLDTFDVSKRETTTHAEWNWKLYYVDVTMDGETELKVEGDEKILSLVKTKMQNAGLTMRKMMTQGLFATSAGNSGKDINTLIEGIATTGTYGAIDKATYSWWQGSVNTTGGTTTLDMLQTRYADCSDGAIQPDLIITTDTIYNKIWARVQPAQRYLTDAHADVRAAGFTGINFNQAAIVVDKYCPSGYMFMLNTDYWKFITHSKRNFKWTSPKVPIDQDAYVRQLLWAGNCVCVAPRWQAYISSMT